ncbi:MAG: alpha/beta hydrolase [Actinobacteria bacterium]|nr:alpha/beta hydrolase [Actinomycetota bacterium]
MLRTIFSLLGIVLCATGCSDAGKVSNREVPQQSVTFTTQDGVTLSGRIFGNSDVGVVLAHMYPKDQSSWHEFAEILAVEGYQALAFDFRGYGISTGSKDISVIERDILAAMAALRERGAKHVFVVGASMGGTAALVAATHEDPAGIVALSPPVDFQGLDASKAVSASSCPKLFLAAEGDGTVSSTQTLFQLANEPKRIVMVPGFAHGSELLKGKEGAGAQRLVIDFLAAHAGP